MKLKTEYVYPPIPIRSWDWMAYDEDEHDGAEDSHPLLGWGANEEAAKADFIDQWMERESERPAYPESTFSQIEPCEAV